MSLANYSRYRRLKLRAAWKLAGMAVLCKEVGGYLVAFLVALAVAQIITDRSIAEDDAYNAVQKLAHIEQAMMSCLSERGVWINDSLHLCSVQDTKIGKGDFR